MTTLRTFCMLSLTLTACATGSTHVASNQPAPGHTVPYSSATYSLTGVYDMTQQMVSDSSGACGGVEATASDAGTWAVTADPNDPNVFAINTEADSKYGIYSDAQLVDDSQLTFSSASVDDLYNPGCNQGFPVTTETTTLSLDAAGNLVGTVVKSRTGGCSAAYSCTANLTGTRR